MVTLGSFPELSYSISLMFPVTSTNRAEAFQLFRC